MEKTKHYSDEDFQMILDNQFKGDKKTFEAHMKSCAQCHKNFTTYSAVFQFLKYKVDVPELGFDLAEEVLKRASKPNGVNILLDKIINGLFVVVVSLIVIMCLFFLISTSITIGAVVLTILLSGAYLVVSMKEMRILLHRYSNIINL